ncbi:MAG: flagellar assembly protein FliX [Stappiaceae bacterium]
MRIQGPGPVSSTRGKGAARKTSGSGSNFQIESDTPQSAESQTANATIAPQGLDALLALQAVEDPLSGRKKAAQAGHDILDGLEKLKIDLLAGKVPIERLETILNLLKTRNDSGDSELEQVMGEIELRANVELAKLGRFVD